MDCVIQLAASLCMTGQDVTEYLEALEQAAEAADYATIVQSAHALERVANVMQTGVLAPLASQLAASAQAGDLDQISESLGQIRAKSQEEADFLWKIAGYE